MAGSAVQTACDVGAQRQGVAAPQLPTAARTVVADGVVAAAVLAAVRVVAAAVLGVRVVAAVVAALVDAAVERVVTVVAALVEAGRVLVMAWQPHTKQPHASVR